MSSASLAQRVFRTVGESPLSERVADAQATLYEPLLDRAVRSPLHTAALGHSVHPLLTDVTLGCWLSASLLDVAGGPGSRRSARLLVAGHVVMTGAGPLGGHLALVRGTARRTPAVR